MPDLCGHGLSSRPDASYSLEWHSQVLVDWLDELGLDEIDLVGHSYGGGVAQWMLIEHGHRVRRLALVAAGGLGREVSVALRLAALPRVIEHLGQPFMAPGTFIALQVLLRRYSTRELMDLSWMNRRRGTARAFSRSLREVVGLGGQRRGFYQHSHQIATLPPVGLFWGDADPVIPIAHAFEAARCIDGASVTRFPGCGHYPHCEAPNEFAEALEAFLAREREVVTGAGKLTASRRPPDYVTVCGS
jgi:pimeloyl-ACP methyl ester carboxylesterase